MAIRISKKLLSECQSFEFLGLDPIYFHGVSPNYHVFINGFSEKEALRRLKKSISESIFHALDRISAIHFADFESYASKEIEAHGGVSYVRKDDVRIHLNGKIEILEGIKLVKKMVRSDPQLALFEVRVHFTLENAKRLGLNELYSILFQNRIVYRGVFLTGKKTIAIDPSDFEPTVNKYFLAFFDKQWNTVFYNGCFEILEFERFKLEQAVRQKGDELNVES